MTKENFDPNNIKALALDLDGTLLMPDKSVTDRTLRILRLCMEKGIHVIIATGRSVSSGEKYKKMIGASGPHVYYNGAEVIDMSAGKLIFAKYVNPEPILFCARLAKQYGIYFQAFFADGNNDTFSGKEPGLGEILMTERITEETEQYIKSSGIKVTVGDFEKQSQKTPAIIKAMFITPEENHEKLRLPLKERFGESLYIVQTTPVFLEVMACGVSKGAGLIHALEYLDIKPGQTIAFGDEENDLSMMEIAGFSAAPANAKANVRKAAMFQIPADTEDGVAVFLEEHFGD